MSRASVSTAVFLVAAALLVSACGSSPEVESSELHDLQLVAVDFQLNSIVITNNGNDTVRTQGLWAYQNGEAFEFNIFSIEPRANIVFSVRRLGQVENSGGEIALFSSDTFSDPDAMIDYVAWGTSEHSRSQIAAEALLWSGDDEVETEEGTIILVRTDSSAFGPIAWDPSSELP